MKKIYLITCGPHFCVRSRNQLNKIIVVTVLLAGCSAVSLYAQRQAHGSSIRGSAIAPVTNSLSAPMSPSTNSDASSGATNSAGELLVGFNTLAGYLIQIGDNVTFNTNNPALADEEVNAFIPSRVKAYDGKKVQVEGFMMPTTWDKQGKVTDFMLIQNQVSCCYGGPSQVNEFINVHVNGKPVAANMDSTVPVSGVLHVGAKRENGLLVGIYRLDASTNLEVKPSY